MDKDMTHHFPYLDFYMKIAQNLFCLIYFLMKVKTKQL